MIFRSEVSNSDILFEHSRNKFEKTPHSYTDFTLLVKENGIITTFHVHKLILSKHSSYFKVSVYGLYFKGLYPNFRDT